LLEGGVRIRYLLTPPVCFDIRSLSQYSLCPAQSGLCQQAGQELLSAPDQADDPLLGRLVVDHVVPL